MALIPVRCWLEASHGDASVVRGYFRDLLAGEEVPIGDTATVEQQVRQRHGLPERLQRREPKRRSA